LLALYHIISTARATVRGAYRDDCFRARRYSGCPHCEQNQSVRLLFAPLGIEKIVDQAEFRGRVWWNGNRSVSACECNTGARRPRRTGRRCNRASAADDPEKGMAVDGGSEWWRARKSNDGFKLIKTHVRDLRTRL